MTERPGQRAPRRSLGACDWVVIRDAVAGVAPKKGRPQEGRRLIIRYTDGLNVLLFIRTTQPWTGPLIVEHPKHDGICGEPDCAIDKDGRVNLGDRKILSSIDVADSKYSCHEPYSRDSATR